MREIQVTITFQVHCHGMTMAEAIKNAISYLPQEPHQLTVEAHDILGEEE